MHHSIIGGTGEEPGRKNSSYELTQRMVRFPIEFPHGLTFDYLKNTIFRTCCWRQIIRLDFVSCFTNKFLISAELTWRKTRR